MLMRASLAVPLTGVSAVAYLYLSIAIVSEVLGTTALKASEEFTRPWPSVFVIVSYGISFYFLSLVLRSIPVGVAYAIWAGLGIVLIALLGAFVYKQVPDVPAMLGMALIVAGVVVINLFSSTVSH
jgi:small multidrug resistance pump